MPPTDPASNRASSVPRLLPFEVPGYVPAVGESVHQAAAAALALAGARGAAVEFDLLRTAAEARPGETPGAVALRWYERRRLDAAARTAASSPRRPARPTDPAGPVATARQLPLSPAT